MERADFVHLVRLSEHACADDSSAYRRSVAAFAALGYAWVVGCLLLALGCVAWTVSMLLRGQFRFFMAWGLLVAAGLLWTCTRALWCRFAPPEGLKITAAEAPALFDALERIRRKVQGPPLHAVYLDGDFNASISQHPRWGLFGGTRNQLVIGLPLMMGLDRPRLLAVLAHEYGHLRGGHGRFAAWIYRTRLSWARLNESMEDDGGPIAAATQGFLRWYFPRFVARTFALARQDEYEADRIAARLVGPDVAGGALVELVVKSAWLQQDFWPRHWSNAAGNPLPQGPFEAMRQLLALAPPAPLARDSLRSALRRLSDVDDTHPVLRDRLESLDTPARLPDWSRKPALELLGKQAGRCIAHFDRLWCRENASAWKQHHADLGRVRARVDALRARQTVLQPDELVELARLQRRLAPGASGRELYEHALALAPQHAGALLGLADSLDPGPQRLAVLERLHADSPDRRWNAASMAVADLEQDAGFDTARLQQWRERLRMAEEAEKRAWEELNSERFFDAIAPHDLGEFDLGELQTQLDRCDPVSRAWLVCKRLQEFRWRRCYLLFLELPDLDDGQRWHLCRALERTLSLPGPVMVLWVGYSPSLADIARHAGPPVFPAG